MSMASLPVASLPSFTLELTLDNLKEDFNGGFRSCPDGNWAEEVTVTSFGIEFPANATVLLDQELTSDLLDLCRQGLDLQRSLPQLQISSGRKLDGGDPVFCPGQTTFPL